MTSFFDTARRACVLVPLFSLRSSRTWGVGEIGDLASFARWAAKAGFSIVQVLPFHEVWMGHASPYSAISAFAIDPVYLSLDDCEDFVAAGGVEALPAEIRALRDTVSESPRVSWDTVRAVKLAGSRLAFGHFLANQWGQDGERGRALRQFMATHDDWLADLTLYHALATAHGSDWMAWPAALRAREPAALEAARIEHADHILWRAYVEWQLTSQWQRARAEAAEVGVALAGDLPFAVSRDAADVWAHQDDYHLDLRLGVPPDFFSEDGQDWGLPVYRWEKMAAEGFPWMSERARYAGTLCSLWRVDHVIGLYRSYYRSNDGRKPGFLPPEEPAQIRQGEAVLEVLAAAGEIVAEDLGFVPKYMRPSLTRLGIPGYKVLRWEQERGHFHDPARWPARSVATTGTHDTESLAAWYDGLTAKERKALYQLPGLNAAPPAAFDDQVRDDLLHLVYQAGSSLAVLPFPDLLGRRDRINVPGTVSASNWTHRLPMRIADLEADADTTSRLAALAQTSGRWSSP